LNSVKRDLVSVYVSATEELSIGTAFLCELSMLCTTQHGVCSLLARTWMEPWNV
jgi:hypothetical protein